MNETKPPKGPYPSGKMRRAKGVRAEREVAMRLQLAGLQVRGLEGSGDHLVFGHRLGTLHCETKHQETSKIFPWLLQAISEAPPGTVPIVAFRRNRSEWYVALRLEDFLDSKKLGLGDE